jgi:hypothetical protein
VAREDAPYFGETGALWDVVTIAGYELPGAASVTGTAFKHRTDNKTTAGKHGSTVTLQGYDAAAFEVTLRMWTQAQLDTFRKLLAHLKPAYPQPPKPAAPNVAPEADFATNYYAVGQLPAMSQARGPDDFPERVYAASLIAGKKLEDKRKESTAQRTPAPVSIYHPKLQLFGITTAHVLECSLPEDRAGILEVKLKCLQHVARRAAVTMTPRAPLELSKLLAKPAATTSPSDYAREP